MRKIVSIFLAAAVSTVMLSCSLSNSSVNSNSSGSSSIPATTVVNTGWKYLGGYSNDIVIYNAVSISNDVTNYTVYYFLADKLLFNNYSNDVIVNSGTNTDVYTTENSQTWSNSTQYIRNIPYSGTLVYSISLSGNNLKLTRASFNGTNSSGTFISTNYTDNMYAYFEKY